MSRTSRLTRLLTLVLALALLVAFTPVTAGARIAPRSLKARLTMADIKKRGPEGLRALDILDEEPIVAHISGHVTHTSGMWEDAGLMAVAYQDFSGYGDWFPVAGSDVATDGSYTIDLAEAGNYRVGVFDWAYVYRDAFYNNATDVDTATTVEVLVNTTLPGIDIAVTPFPENIISGTVSFSGAATPTANIEKDDYVLAAALVYDSEAQEWYDGSEGLVHADGTYRIHLPEAGTYRVGFHDFSGVFADAYYKDAKAAKDAADVTCPDPGNAPSGIDQTMTIIPSHRISGDSRYDTAAEVCKYGFPDGDMGYSVVLATGENWPDAISGSAMAARIGAPLLLTRARTLPQVTADEISRLQPREVIIVGGYSAVSLDVEIALRTQFDVPLIWRIAGRDRYETSALVAEQLTKGDGIGPAAVKQPKTVFSGVVLATGEKFPDAMSAAPLAANADAPVLLGRRDGVPASVAAFMQRHAGDYTSALVVGSTSVISNATTARFPNPTRIYGPDRYGTSAAVAQYGVDHFGMRGGTVGVASGVSFPDGLAAVPVLAMDGEPLLLTRPDKLSQPAEAFMTRNHTARALVFGSESVVSAAAFERILQVLQ